LGIKFFSGGELATTLAVAHAKALAKVDHTNNVKVHFVDSAVHPATGERTPCVACELSRGGDPRRVAPSTAANRGANRARRGSPYRARDHQRRRHIHARETIHGDLHSGNVMVANGAVKVIDLYSTGSLRALTSAPRELRVRADVSDLAASFGVAAFGKRRTLKEVRAAFEIATRP
jgi:predicted trehalose synthase